MNDFLLRALLGICVGIVGGLGAAKIIDVISTASATALQNTVSIIGR